MWVNTKLEYWRQTLPACPLFFSLLSRGPHEYRFRYEMCSNKDIFLSNKNRDYDMQVKLQIYEGGSELERDHTGNGYQPDKNENQGFD